MHQRALQTLFVAATLLLTTTACDQGGDSKGAANNEKVASADAKLDVGKKAEDAAPEASKTEEPAAAEAGNDDGAEAGAAKVEGDEAAALENDGEAAAAETDAEPDETNAAEASEKDAPKAAAKSAVKSAKDGGGEKDSPKDGGDVTASKIDAKSVYNGKCRSCHGADGKGETTIGKKLDIPSLVKTSLSKAKVIAIIEDGVPGTKMKGYKGKLSPEEIDAVADYVKKL